MQDPPRSRLSATDAPGELDREGSRAPDCRYRKMFEAARDGILLVNADTGKIEDANPSLTRLLGYSHADLLGKKLWQLVSSEDAQYQRAQEHGEVFAGQ
jgi:PAS domain S-box-containing protein